MILHTHKSGTQWPVAAANILVTQLRQVGDVLLTTPAVKVLRDHYPDSRITYLTETGPAMLLQGNPHIDCIITRHRNAPLLQDFKLAYRLRQERYDLVIDFFCNPRSAWMSFLTGARHRVAGYHAGRAWWYTYTPAIKTGDGYAVNDRLALLRTIGIDGELGQPVLKVPKEARNTIAGFFKTHNLEGKRPIVTIDITSRRPAKRWIPERYVQVADRLTEKLHATVIFIWGPGEKELVETYMQQGQQRHVLACETNLMQLAALIERSHLHIGNCSAPRHIAVAVDTPSLTVMGPTDVRNWTYPSPRHQVVQGDVPCLACHKTECSTHECMQALTVDEVETAALNMLRET
jgi:ADP-heptose:LPS heptosyltransferase